MPVELKAQAELELRRRYADARSSLKGFTQKTKPDMQFNWFHDRICAELDQFLIDVAAGLHPRLMLIAPPRHGKQLADHTDVLTTKGWKKHGELRVGDFVFHPSGKPTCVVALGKHTPSDVKIEFTNGEVVYCHPDHEWVVFDRSDGKRDWFQYETRHFMRKTRFGKAVDVFGGGRPTYLLPIISALEFPEAKVPVSPYVLGAWLGDGSVGKPCITWSGPKKKVIDAIVAAGYKVSSTWVHQTTGITTTSFGGVVGKAGKLTHDLQTAGVFDRKHIPVLYRYASIGQRLELLAGLTDTDGNVDPNSGRVSIATTIKEIADAIAEVARSLGWHAYFYVQQPKVTSSGIHGRKKVYYVGFQPDMDIPTQVVHKKITRLVSQRHRVGIKSVKQVANSRYKGRCIQVEAEDGLYLVGKTLIPTHNSETVSRRFPAYVFGRFPHWNVMACSYAAPLAQRMNRDVQRIIDTPMYRRIFPDTNLNVKNIATLSGQPLRNAHIFEIISAKSKQLGQMGSYRGAGVGEGITGMGFDIGIIDDPVKDAAQAASETERNSIWEWYESVFYNRGSPNSGILLVMTRWHEDDLAGRLLHKAQYEGGDQWRVVRFPALAEEHADRETEGDPRQPGEALHPERYPKERLEQIRAVSGSYSFGALFQGRPTPKGGGILTREDFRFYRRGEIEGMVFDLIAVSVDAAFKDTATSAYVAIQAWGRRGIKHFLLGQIRKRLTFTNTIKEINTIRSRFAQVNAVLIEDKANGTAIIDVLSTKVPGVIAIEPVGSKEARAEAAAPLIEAGNVIIPDPQEEPWVEQFIHEWLSVPIGAFWDQVDAADQYLLKFGTTQTVNLTPAAVAVAETEVMSSQSGSPWSML